MSKSFYKGVTISLVPVILGFTLAACGKNDPYGIGLSKFDNQVLAHRVKHPNSDWTVYVAHGTVTTGWLWFRKQNAVVYAEADYTGPSTSTNVVIHFGDKNIKSPAQVTGSGIGFYLKSSRIPQVMDISWKVNGQSRHLEIGPQDGGTFFMNFL